MPGFAIKCFAIVMYKMANVAKGRKKNTVILHRKNARVQKKSTDVQHTCTNVDSSAYTTLSNLVIINIGLQQNKKIIKLKITSSHTVLYLYTILKR